VEEWLNPYPVSHKCLTAAVLVLFCLLSFFPSFLFSILIPQKNHTKPGFKKTPEIKRENSPEAQTISVSRYIALSAAKGHAHPGKLDLH
jgi:hypothetical protein